jgi:hypothetical protein
MRYMQPDRKRLEVIEKGLKSGKSVARIAGELGMSRQGVYYHLTKARMGEPIE